MTAPRDMSTHEPKRERGKRPERRPLVSGFSILIFSSFLIGAAAGRFVTGGAARQTMTAGVAGILAFVGLDSVTRWRKLCARQAEQLNLEKRLARHVDRCAVSGAEEVDSEEIEDVDVYADELRAAC